MGNQFKVVFLWVLILLGFVFHSLLAAMPLFFGESITIPDATGAMPESMNWMSLSFYLIPMVLITLVIYFSATWFRIINLLLAIAFTALNAFHLVSDIGAEGFGVQPILLSYILIASVLLTLASYRWFREQAESSQEAVRAVTKYR